MKYSKHNQSGFTLVELLIVIGILAVLMAITIIAINPVQQLQNARNSQRQSDVASIMDGIYQYEATNGKLPPTTAGLSTVGMVIGAQTTLAPTGTSFASPNLTFSGLSGNTVTSGTVLVSGCSQAGDNGNFNVTSGTATTLVVNDTGGSATSATGCVISTRLNPCPDLVATYLAALPMDPTGSTGTSCSLPFTTGYTVAMNATGNRFTVSAPSAENGATISISR